MIPNLVWRCGECGRVNRTDPVEVERNGVRTVEILECSRCGHRMRRVVDPRLA